MAEQIGGQPAILQSGARVVPPTQAQAPAQQIAVVPVNTSLAVLDVPEFMDVGDDNGLALMKQYVVPPRLKIVQGQSQIETKQQFGESSIIVTPDNVLLTSPIDFKSADKQSDIIRVVPLFFYPEFLHTSPMDTDEPFILERSTDPDSKLALRCRGQFDKREYTTENGIYRYLEVLNFIVSIWYPEHFTDPVLVTFKRSDFAEGRKWCKIASIPKNPVTKKHIPCFGQVFNLCCSPRKKDKFNWYGWDVASATTENGLVELVRDEQMFRYGQMMHKEFTDAHAEGKLRATYDDEEETSGTETSGTRQVESELVKPANTIPF